MEQKNLRDSSFFPGQEKGKNLHELFIEQAELKPDQIALVGPYLEREEQDCTHVSYGELNKRSTELASQLREKGIKEGHIVAIVLERSVEMITAILGILKTGAAYLPIEPGTPTIRLLSMLEDCQVGLVVTSHAITDTLMTRLQMNGTYAFTILQGLQQKKLTPRCTPTSISTFLPANRMVSHVADKIVFLDLSRPMPSPHHGFVDLNPLKYDVTLPFIHFLQHQKDNTEGHIYRAGLDFVNYFQLKRYLANIQADIMVISTLPAHKDFFHQAVSLIRSWGFRGLIVATGPYATEEWSALLQDRNLDLAIRCQEQNVLTTVLENLLDHHGQLPPEPELNKLPYLAYIPRPVKQECGYLCARHIVLMDRFAQVGSDVDSSFFSVPVFPSVPAYVMYTSGSTGSPKASAVTHCNVTSIILDSSYLTIESHDRLLQLCNCAFDGSVFDIFAALLNGATLVLPDTRPGFFLEKLASLIKTEKISVLLITTALFNAWVDRNVESFSPLRKLLFGGEQVSLTHVQKALAYLGPGKLLHMYGPTETTVYATYYPVEHIAAGSQTIPIGSPLAHASVYLLDNQFKPVPSGVTGQICIGGAGVCLGYLNQPELTAEKFISNPFASGERLYLSSDLARKGPDGQLEFIGRMDQQIKIRGFRIEPKEIESCLLQINTIQKALVIARESSSGERLLCAYIVPNREVDERFDLHTVKETLTTHLPDYMVPAHFLLLEDIPLNANGKTNLAMLPDPWLTHAPSHDGPTNTVEEVLIEVWEEVLNLEREQFGIKANFFQLCSHSLKIAQLKTKIQKAFDVSIPLVALFKNPTIKEFAHWLTTSAESTYSSIPIIEQQEYYNLSPVQQWLWSLSHEEEATVSFNLPMIKIIESHVDISVLARVFSLLVERHESLRTVFTRQGGVLKQTILLPHQCDFNVEYLDFSQCPEHLNKAQKWIKKEAALPFQIDGGPLIKVVLIRLFSDRFLFFLHLHHLIGDAFSMEVLWYEMSLAYFAFIGGSSHPFKPLRTQYKDYAAWHNQQLKSKAFKIHQKYWVHQLKRPIPGFSFVSESNTVSVIATNRHNFFWFPGDLWQQVNTFSENHHLPFQVTLLSALSLLWFRLFHQEDIIFGVVAGGRENSDLQMQVGAYAHILPIRIRFGMHLTFHEIVQKVHLTFTAAEKHSTYPVPCMKNDATGSSLIDLQLMFNVLIFFLPVVFPVQMGSSFQVQDIYWSTPATPFDLTLRFIIAQDNLAFHCISNCAKIQEASIHHLAQQFFAILERVIHTPDLSPIASCELPPIFL